MRQRRHTLQVSTFPFLAVLLCTMGSLILLLLVIDRRARVVARAKALRAAALVAAEDAQAQARRQAELEHRQQALHAQLQKQDQDVLSQIQTANQENTAAGADVRREQTQIQELQKKIQTESARLTQEQKEIQARRAKVSQTTANTEAARRDLARLNGDLTQLERTLADLKEARQRDAHKYSLVPYRGRRGDGRRPLYVECGDESIIFHPERASLAGLQMTLGNIRTEVDQRLAHKRQAAATAKEKSETPYLLLLVRPNGVRTYYKVLSALEGLKIDFGYEFVDADWVLDFPENGDAAPQPWMVAEQTAAAPPATSRTSASKAPAKLAGGDWSPIGSVDGSASGPTATVHGPAPLAPGGRGVGGEGETTNAVPLLVSRLPEVLEAAGEHATAEKAQPVTVPCGISGCLEKEGEADCYAFEAKAGERFTFRVVARDCWSEIDSNLRILNAKGERLVENDDARDRFVHADSLLENWAAPAAGRYVVEVRDLHARGGPGFVYFLEVTRSQPYFTLELDTDKTLLAPGTAAVIFARAARKNGFAGEVQLAVEGLPPGVRATCGRILAGGNDGCILLQAEPGAKPCAANLRVTGAATHAEGKEKPVTLQAVARPLQEVYMPGGGRFHFPVEMHTLSIGDPLDLRSVKITPTAITLKPGESKRIDVVIERAPGFKGNVTLDTVYQHLGTIYGGSMPPGVAIDDKASQTLLSGEQVKGHITLRAAPDAKPAKEQLIPVMAHVSINFVMKYTCCGEPLKVSVESSSPAK